MNKRHHNIVLTGGPCAGKTSAMEYLRLELIKSGFEVIVVPEVATLVINSGIMPYKNISVYDFQKILFQTILDLEKNISDYAFRYKGDKRIVFLHDRGLCDAKPYLSSPTEFEKMLSYFQMKLEEVFARYDGVVHLVTAADGAEEFYTNSNNSARSESVEQAREIDLETMRAWEGHDKVYVIKNSGTFKEKCEETLEAVLSVIGHPERLEIERKFRLDLKYMSPRLVGEATPKKIEQIYLQNLDGHVERVRKTFSNAHVKYFHTIKKLIGLEIGCVEEEVEISEEEYFELQKRKDETRKAVYKTRYYKFFGRDYFSIDVFVSPEKDYSVLEIEFPSLEKATKFVLPKELVDFVELEDVTHLAEYSNNNIAK